MSDSRSSISVLWNAKSGWEAGDKQATKVCELLTEIDPDLHFCRIDNGGDIVRLAREQIKSGSKLLVAAGGDGTLNAVASVLVHQPATLGVIPAGTLNHFARDLGIAIDPVAAAAQIRDGRELSVDAGSVNGRIFINNSVLGLYPIYRAARRSLESRGLGNTAIGRFFAVLGGILRVSWRLPHLRLRIVTDSGVSVISSPFVLVANNEHELETGRIGKRTALNQGHLWVYVMRRCNRWSLFRYFLRFVAGRFSRGEAFEEFKVRELRIETRRKRVGVGVDGEIVHMQSPLDYRSLPGALRVMVPADSPML